MSILIDTRSVSHADAAAIEQEIASAVTSLGLDVTAAINYVATGRAVAALTTGGSDTDAATAAALVRTIGAELALAAALTAAAHN